MRGRLRDWEIRSGRWTKKTARITLFRAGILFHIRPLFAIGGALGAAVAQLLYTETVTGSNPVVPTIPRFLTRRDTAGQGVHFRLTRISIKLLPRHRFVAL